MNTIGLQMNWGGEPTTYVSQYTCKYSVHVNVSIQCTCKNNHFNPTKPDSDIA